MAKMIRRKSMAILLTLAMVIGFLPALTLPASAADPTTETFEACTTGDTSFTSGGVTFSLAPSDGFKVHYLVFDGHGCGYGSSSYFIDNNNYSATSFSISSASVFSVKSLYLYPSTSGTGDSNQTSDVGVTFTGKLSGTTKFTYSPDSSLFAAASYSNETNRGFSLIDFSAQGYGNTAIDELDISLSGTTVYIAIDNFTSIAATVPAPIFTSGDTASFAENATGAAYTAAATPTDGGTVTYSLSGGADQSLFKIDSSTGAVTFIGSPDYENPTDSGTDYVYNVYNITVKATESGGGEATKDVAITVTDANDVNFSIADNDGGTSGGAIATNKITRTMNDTDGGTVDVSFSTVVGGESPYTCVYAANGGTGWPSGLYNYTGDASNVKLQISVPDGYTFDLSGFKFVAESPGVSKIDVGTSGNLTEYGSFSVTQDGSKGYTLVKPSSVNDVTSVILSASDYTLFQDIEITITKVNTAPFTRDITSFLQLGAGATAMTASGTVATTQTDNITLESWIYLENTTGTHALLFNGNGGSSGYGIFLNYPGASPLSVLLGGAGWIYCSSGTSYDAANNAVLTAGQWTHVAVTRNTSDGGTQGWKIYINGKPLATCFVPTPGPTATPKPMDGNSNVQIGGATDPAGLSVSEARIWNRALTQAEIQANMSGTVATNAADLVGYWKLTDGSGATVADIHQSTTEHPTLNLPINGSATWVASTAGITAEDTAISGQLAGGDMENWVTYAKASNPAHGAVTVNSDGSYTYTPAANYNGDDSFTFVTNDGSAESAPRTVSINVTAVNDAPSITSGATASFAENGTGTVYTATGTDPESDTLTWSISGTDAALFNIDSDTGALTFKTAPNYESPADSDTNNSYIVEIQASDGTATSTKTVTVTVTNVNEAPTDIALSNSSVNENTPSGTAVGTLSATDIDSGDTFTYTLVSGTGDTDNASFTIDGSSLKLAVSPDYETKSSYSVCIQTKDAAGATYSEAFTITVTNVNDAPSITVPGSITVTEDAATALTGISFADADAGSASVTVTLSVASGTLAATTGSNVTVGGTATALTLTGSIADINTFIAAGKVTFTTASDATANVTLTIAINDGGNTGAGGEKTDSTTVTLSVTAVNDAPSITSDATASFAENGTGTVYTATASDPDTGDTVTWSISGTDADLFAIDSGTGALTFKTAPNYESPADSGKDNVYNITVTATDSGSLTATKGVAITVTDVNEAPTDIALSSSSVNENTPSGTAVGTLSAADPDSGNTFTYALATGTGSDDNGSFTIDGNTLKTNAVFNYDVKQSYKIRVRTTDQNGLFFEEAFTISITEVNVAPTDISLSATSIAENCSPNTEVGTLSAVDTNTSESFSYAFVAGAGDADNASFNISGDKLRLTNSADYETQSSYSVRIKVTDKGGLTYEKAFAITVTDVNDAPTITSGDSAGFAENGTGTVYTATGSDEDGNTITWSVSGGDAALLSINSSSGALTFKTAPNYEAPTDSGTNNVYNITVTATDNGAGALTATKVVAITVTDVNEAPSITSGNSESVSENTTGTAYTATYTDPDAGDTITWSLGGTDAALFSIDSDGKVTFISAPDYESPADSGKDNVYNITVTATDSGSLSAAKDVAITVTDVNEAPTITAAAALSVAEGSTAAFTAAATDPDGNVITWSITGGADAGKFSIAPSTGVVTFITAPSYSTPTDADAHNDYVLEITATDGTLSAVKTVTVTVTPAPSSDATTTPNTDATVLVNGESKTAGTSQTTTNSNGQKTTTVTVDTAKLQTILDSQKSGATVTIPITNNSDVAAGTLTGAMVKNMGNKDATLVLLTDSGTYTLPASQINIDAVSQQLGKNVSLSDINVTVSIAEPSAAMTRVVENAAHDGGYTIMVPAVDYTITCTHGGQTVNVSSFNAYVERTIAIPDGVDHSKITTGVVVESDGTTHHVPTKITVINGKYYAVINSLTNSTYSVVWNPVEFSDVTNHWAKDAVNDMGSRMVVTGVGNNNYAPDRDMTRAEFATIMIRALGLEPGTGAAGFRDVAATDWYNGYIKTAASYGIIKGYDNGNFGPNDTITREQAMTMISRAMTITKLSTGLADGESSQLLSAFSDGESASTYAEESIAACLKTGIVSGTSDTTISPTADITRAEVAVMVERLLQKSNLI